MQVINILLFTYVAIEIAQVIALDFSKEQLQVAASRQQERSRACYKNIE